ncbi:hypothetical protein WOLCODRAFT_168087 [Wolfiporia cocos MD-104 SS10]|uniref:Uncharacterized protein n=1 Tax=Wolfiporia cocos (strain MD-104) TaxID=742152 RepID=A0A2H3JLD1_WOLCO|nr:hypothetical protein WOLCODRAFT_168087 [Wolfiporia cocos MD-104 SS10]
MGSVLSEVARSAQADDISELTVKEILARLNGRLAIPRTARTSKSGLVRHVVQSAADEDILWLSMAGRARRTEQDQGPAQRKRKRAENQFERRHLAHPRRDREVVDELDRSSFFMQLPSAEQLKNCHIQFHAATSNLALQSAICVVCARWVYRHDLEITKTSLEDLPNTHRLIPKKAHPRHILTEGKLLEPSAVIVEGDRHILYVCAVCLKSLRSSADKPPELSLANRMWIGEIPWQLRTLTLPEKQLIALVYPRVFVFKLYPKKLGGRRDERTLQYGMRGTVTTFSLDMAGVSTMLEGRLMPRPPSLLASVISVTFIGAGRLPKDKLRGIFRVRRRFVLDALLWLKANNPKYYGDITISEEHVAQLPEDDVPEEIMGTLRQETDVGLIDRESAGYVPEVEVNEGEDEREDGTNDEEGDADVIPLQLSGMSDTDSTAVHPDQMMMWALSNLWKEGREGGYLVRYGQPVRDFPGQPAEGDDEQRMNLSEMAFPCLFPYGEGGIEAPREVAVSFTSHVRWALQYHDRRFRTDKVFPFWAFGIEQKRQALTSARIKIRRTTFHADAQVLGSLTVDRLHEAAKQQAQKLPITDPAVRLLRQHVHASSRRVMGSDASRYALRSQIWATTVMLGPPSIWITINPSDLDDPIAQILTGVDIDLDQFCTTAGPDRETRARNVAHDPWASAKFFHFIITAIITTLFQVEVMEYQVRSGVGIFGRVSAYFGTVESQNRGTLHLHMLLWLLGVPTWETMRE